MLANKKLQVLILVYAFSQTCCQNATDFPIQINSTTELLPVPTPNITVTKNYDYLVKLLFNIQENKVSYVVVNTIFTDSVNNSINVGDIVQLYGLDNINLFSTNAALTYLNITPSDLLSINGLEVILKDFQINFKNFYEQIFSVKLNISGIPLRNFIQALGIDNGKFTSAMSYNDVDPFEVFKEGNFSKESLEAALIPTEKTLEDLFAACRDEVLSKVVTLETNKLLEILSNYSFKQNEAVQLWKFLNISTENVNAIPVFGNLLIRVIAELNQKTYLGVLIGERNIAINKKVFDIWKNRTISKIYAQSIDNSSTLEIEQNSFNSNVNNITILNVNDINNGTVAHVETTPNIIRNCTFVTLQTNTVVSLDVTEAKYVLPQFEAVLNLTGLELVVGSPLMCQNEVYGLAAELLEADRVVFDSFINRQQTTTATATTTTTAVTTATTSTALNEVFNKCLMFVSILGLYLVY